MKKIKLVDTAFSHGRTTTDLQISEHIEWDRSEINDDDTVVVTDNSLYDVDGIKGRKIGLMIEPISVNPNLYEWVVNNSYKVDRILTYDKTLLDVCENSTFYPHGGCWILPQDQSVHQKSKLVSMIASIKQFTTGHRLRHSIINTLNKNNINFDLYGRGIKDINNKIDGLKDHMFSIVVENIKTDYYFTEKIIDCFRTGTIPIYWGCPSIGDFFDKNGIITFNTELELLEIIKNLKSEDYYNRIDSINKNYEIAKDFLLIENWIYDKLPILK
jgi:hypothetical protein